MKKLAFIIVIISLTSCLEKEVNNYKHNEVDEALIAQLTDLYFMDGYIGRSKKSDRDSLRIKFSEDFKIAHGVSVDSVRMKFKELESNRFRYIAIMDSVILRLNNRKS